MPDEVKKAQYHIPYGENIYMGFRFITIPYALRAMDGGY
jgi:hypothetical protein